MREQLKRAGLTDVDKRSDEEIKGLIQSGSFYDSLLEMLQKQKEQEKSKEKTDKEN